MIEISSNFKGLYDLEVLTLMEMLVIAHELLILKNIWKQQERNFIAFDEQDASISDTRKIVIENKNDKAFI